MSFHVLFPFLYQLAVMVSEKKSCHHLITRMDCIYYYADNGIFYLCINR